MQEKGKRIFHKFIEEKKKNLILYMTIWTYLLVIGVLIGFSDIRIMIVCLVFGVTLGFLNIKAWIQYKKTINSISDLEKLYGQLEKTDTNQFKEWKLIITEEHVLSAFDTLQIIPFSDIQKVEIGIQESGLKPSKSLYITKKGISDKLQIAVAYSAADNPNEFYKAFDLIQKKITQK